MPTLFISYKRGTAAVAPLMDKLREAHYRLWFDRDEVHLGDADWQARIDQGLALCDGVILNITPAACASEPVRYEVKKARELGKPIFPIILERITDYDAAIRDLGLAENQHIEDFTDVTKWNEQIQRLIRDLETQGLQVTPHDRRQQRNRNNSQYVLHQTYLKRLVERIGTLNLAQINPDNTQGIELERVYVDSPTGLSLSVEVQNWQIVDWGIHQVPAYIAGRFPEEEVPWSSPEELGWSRGPIEALVSKLDSIIASYHSYFPKEKPTDPFNSWKNGQHNDVLSLHLAHLAAARNRLVILGAPGSGKSTFVKYLALCLAGAGIDNWTREARITVLDNWSHGALTPIYIELRRFVASKHFPTDLKTPVTADHFWAYIEDDVLGESLKAYGDDLRYDLEHGYALLILDGLDEVPYPEGQLKARQNQLISLAQSLNTRYQTSRILVASRPYAYEGWKLPGFESVTITAFENDHRIELAKHLYRVAGLVVDVAQNKAEALNNQLQSIDAELKDRPLFVTLMATIYLRSDSEGLPTRRGALYRESIQLLLDRWTQSKAGAPSLIEILGDHTLDDLYIRLAALAYDVHNRYGEQSGTPEIDESLLYRHLRPLGRTIAAELIPYLSENAGVLVSPGQNSERDVFHFAHRTFQEYLVAVYFVRVCAEADSFAFIREQIMTKPLVWGAPCMLAGDVLADTDRRGDLWDLLDDLLDFELPDTIEATDPRWWTVWLASVILQDQKMLGGKKLRQSERAVCNQLRNWIIKLIQTPKALEPIERATCGRALSLLGDPRLGVGNMTAIIEDKTVELPQIEWCDIAVPLGGNYMVVADNQENNPRDKVEVKHDFKMAKYLITYLQFQTFANSGEYDNAEWWEEFPSEYQPQALGDQHNPYANHPRDGISWYQATAFCRWLTAKYRQIGFITSDQVVRLPTEEEWEYAARGIDGREYPYGNEFDADKGNVYETHIGQSSAVGIFPDGVSPFDLLDMSGNVWEWCTELTDKLHIRDEDYYIDLRYLKGGAFIYYHDAAGCSAFTDSRPYSDYVYFGLRVLLSGSDSLLIAGSSDL